jgi:hypothetical protein
MTRAESWAEAIGAEQDETGQLTLGTVVAHIRDAVNEIGFVSQGRITRGLKEAYRPLGVDEDTLGKTIKQALRILLLSGDVDEFATSAGRGYAATPPRRVAWSPGRVTLLGRAFGGVPGAIVRHVAGDEMDYNAITIPLTEELGRPEWRSALVDLNAADVVNGDASALFEVAASLAGSGERYSLDEPHTVAVLSGRGKFFGDSEQTPSGRWQRVAGDGCFPAVIKSGYTSRYVVLNVANGTASLWQPASLDIWRWVTIGATLAIGDPAVSYDASSQRLDFLTPPPHQLERAALLTGTQIGPWSWNVDSQVYEVIAKFLKVTR